MSNYDKEEVITKFLEGAQVVDDHTGKEMTNVTAIIELNNDRGLCQYVDGAAYQSLNRIYYHSDSRLHISTQSIGGVLIGNLTEESINKYNDYVTFDSLKIKRVVFKDGFEIVCKGGDRMDIYEYAERNNADYMDMSSGIIYHVQEYNRAKSLGLPTQGIRCSRDGKTIGYAEKKEH